MRDGMLEWLEVQEAVTRKRDSVERQCDCCKKKRNTDNITKMAAQ